MTPYTMLTIGGLILLMVAVINANRVIVSADIEPARSESQSIAVALAEELMGEIRTRRFDQNTPDSAAVVTNPSGNPGFTSDAMLGPDGLDASVPNPDTAAYRSIYSFNDIDDYKGYTRIVNTSVASGFQIDSDVYYVSESDFSTRSYTRTYLKKVTVTVQSPDIAPMSFSTLVAY